MKGSLCHGKLTVSAAYAACKCDIIVARYLVIYLSTDYGMRFAHIYICASVGNSRADNKREYIARAVGMVKSRIQLRKRPVGFMPCFFFVAPEEYEAKSVRKRWTADMPANMAALADLLESQDDFKAAVLEPIVLKWIEEKGLHLGNVMNAFRLTVVGECKGPHMFDITELLGKDETIRRIKAGIERIQPAE